MANRYALRNLHTGSFPVTAATALAARDFFFFFFF